MKEFVTYSPKETFDLGQRIGEALQSGSVICLSGELGAGKTALAQGIAKGIGVEDYITSPTYTIVNEYQGRTRVYHFDVYRLEGEEELYEIGFEEYLEEDGIVVMEWADIVKEAIPREHLWIAIDKGDEFQKRVLSLVPRGTLYEELIREL